MHARTRTTPGSTLPSPIAIDPALLNGYGPRRELRNRMISGSLLRARREGPAFAFVTALHAGMPFALEARIGKRPVATVAR